MADYPFKIDKVVSTLPSKLEANKFYAVRVGSGYDLYLSDMTGSIAHKLNSSGSGVGDGELLTPLKIGSNWYKSGLYYDYNYPVLSSGTTSAQPNNNMLYALPCRILEDATITSLVLNCSTGQAGSTATLAVYGSNADNTINQLLANGSVDLSTTGVKTVNINLPVTKGQVIWLVSLATATGTMASVTAHNLNSTARLIGGSISTSQNGTVYLKGNMTVTNTLTQSSLSLSSGNVPRIMFTV